MNKLESDSHFHSRNNSLEDNETPYQRNFQKSNGNKNSSSLIANNENALSKNRPHVLNGLAEPPSHSSHDMYANKFDTLVYVSNLYSPLPNKGIASEFSGAFENISNSNITLDEEINTFYESVKSSGVSMNKIGGKYSETFIKLIVEKFQSKRITSKKISEKFNEGIAKKFKINKTTLNDWKYSNTQNSAATVALGGVINRLIDNYDRKEFLYSNTEKNTPNLSEMVDFIRRNREDFIGLGNHQQVANILNIKRKYYEGILNLTCPVEDFSENEKIKYKFISKLFEDFCRDWHQNKMVMPAIKEERAKIFISNKKEELSPLKSHYLIAHFFEINPGVVNYYLNDNNAKKSIKRKLSRNTKQPPVKAGKFK